MPVVVRCYITVIVKVRDCLPHVACFLISSEVSLLRHRQPVEDAFFQYAVLRAALWYPHHVDISNLPLRGDAVDTISRLTTVYHGAFMEKYASEYMHTITST